MSCGKSDEIPTRGKQKRTPRELEPKGFLRRQGLATRLRPVTQRLQIHFMLRCLVRFIAGCSTFICGWLWEFVDAKCFILNHFMEDYFQVWEHGHGSFEDPKQFQ